MEPKTNQPKNPKFDFNQEVQIASDFYTEFPDFRNEMLDYVGSKAHIRLVTRDIKSEEFYYVLDLPEYGGRLWWPEFSLTEIN